MAVSTPRPPVRVFTLPAALPAERLILVVATSSGLGDSFDASHMQTNFEGRAQAQHLYSDLQEQGQAVIGGG